jgi:hypothetical protein
VERRRARRPVAQETKLDAMPGDELAAGYQLVHHGEGAGTGRDREPHRPTEVTTNFGCRSPHRHAGRHWTTSAARGADGFGRL